MTTVADLSCSMRTITKIFTLTLNWEAGRPFIRYIVNIDNSNNEDAHCPLSPLILPATTAQANRVVGKIVRFPNPLAHDIQIHVSWGTRLGKKTNLERPM